MRTLNAGCGKQPYGTHFIDKYPNNSSVLKCDIDKDRFPFKDGVFDEVYSKNLFEHLTNHTHFLKECHRVLKKGGKIILITDNANCWRFWLDGHKNDVKYGDNDDHYALFTGYHLRNWFDKNGFDVCKIELISDTYRKGNPIFKPLKIIVNMLLPKRLSCPRIRVDGVKK